MPIVRMALIHIGESTQAHPQSITPMSLSVIKTIVRVPVKPIPTVPLVFFSIIFPPRIIKLSPTKVERYTPRSGRCGKMLKRNERSEWSFNILRRKISPIYLHYLFVFEIIFSYRQGFSDFSLQFFCVNKSESLIHTGFHELAGCRPKYFGVFVFRTRL